MKVDKYLYDKKLDLRLFLVLFRYLHWKIVCWKYVEYPRGIIRLVVIVYAHVWFIRNMWYTNLQFLNTVIIIQAKCLLPQA